MSKVRVLLADDHPNLLEIVESVLEPTFEVVGKVADGKSLLEVASELDPDVIVTDISIPIINGIEEVKTLKASGSRSKGLFLTLHSDHDFVRAGFEAGASGYIMKHQMACDLLEAMRAAFAGRIFVSPNLTSRN
jgi:DNA-binding NarL/FixJ family response regulator